MNPFPLLSSSPLASLKPRQLFQRHHHRPFSLCSLHSSFSAPPRLPSLSLILRDLGRSLLQYKHPSHHLPAATMPLRSRLLSIVSKVACWPCQDELGSPGRDKHGRRRVRQRRRGGAPRPQITVLREKSVGDESSITGSSVSASTVEREPKSASRKPTKTSSSVGASRCHSYRVKETTSHRYVGMAQTCHPPAARASGLCDTQHGTETLRDRRLAKTSAIKGSSRDVPVVKPTAPTIYPQIKAQQKAPKADIAANLLPAQWVCEVLDILGDLLLETSYAVSGDAAMVYYGHVRRQLQHIDIICPPRLKGAILSWIQFNGHSASSQLPDSFCIQTSDGRRRCVRVHGRGDFDELDNMREAWTAARILTLPSIASEAAIDYVEARESDDIPRALRSAADIFWLVRRMMADQREDQRLTQQSAGFLGSVDFLETFLPEYPRMKPLLQEAGFSILDLDAASVSGPRGHSVPAFTASRNSPPADTPAANEPDWDSPTEPRARSLVAAMPKDRSRVRAGVEDVRPDPRVGAYGNGPPSRIPRPPKTFQLVKKTGPAFESPLGSPPRMGGHQMRAGDALTVPRVRSRALAQAPSPNGGVWRLEAERYDGVELER